MNDLIKIQISDCRLKKWKSLDDALGIEKLQSKIFNLKLR